MYTPRAEDVKRIENDFRYHRPHARSQEERYGTIRTACHNLAHHLLTLCPPSRELSLALTNLEQVMFWGNASIARNEKPPDPAQSVP